MPLEVDGIPRPRETHGGRRSEREQRCREEQASSPVTTKIIAREVLLKQLLVVNIVIVPVAEIGPLR